MGRASSLVDVDGLVCVMYVFKKIAVAEHVHCALVVEKDPVWIEASCIVVRVVIYLVKAHAWRGFLVIFVVGLGVVFYLSVAIVCFVVDVHS